MPYKQGNNNDKVSLTSSYDWNEVEAPWRELIESTGKTEFICIQDEQNLDIFSKNNLRSSYKEDNKKSKAGSSRRKGSTSNQKTDHQQHPNSEVEKQDFFLKENYGLFRYLIVPDGNCLYRAVAQALCNNQHQHMELRKEIVQYMKQNLKKFKALIEENHTDYFKEALKENTWGGYLEILAVTALYDINVIIVLGGSEENPDVSLTCHHLSGEIEPKETIWLAWLSKGHYDLIVDYKPSNSDYKKWESDRQEQFNADQKLAKELSQLDLNQDYQDNQPTASDQSECQDDHQLALALQEEYDYADDDHHY